MSISSQLKTWEVVSLQDKNDSRTCFSIPGDKEGVPFRQCWMVGSWICCPWSHGHGWPTRGVEAASACGHCPERCHHFEETPLSLGMLITLSVSLFMGHLSSLHFIPGAMRDRQQPPHPAQRSGLHLPSQNWLGCGRLWGSRGLPGLTGATLPGEAPGHMWLQSPWHEAGSRTRCGRWV